MTDYRLKSESGSYAVAGMGLTATVTRGAESWQFFAFVFAAIVTLAFALLDEIPLPPGYSRSLAKVGAFLACVEVTLINRRCRNKLVGLLIRFKTEGDQ